MAAKQNTSMTDFVSEHGVKITTERASVNPCNPEWREADHWKCRLTCGRRSMTLYFSKGFGHKGKAPDAAEVLDSLASDAAGAENVRSFEEWCGEYGYDTDSRKAERTFKAVERQAEGLKRLLGEEAYKALLWETERL